MKPSDRLKEIMFEKIKACERMEKTLGEYPYFDAILQYLDEQAEKGEPIRTIIAGANMTVWKKPDEASNLPSPKECMVLCDYSGKREPKGLPCRKPLPCPVHSPADNNGYKMPEPTKVELKTSSQPWAQEKQERWGIGYNLQVFDSEISGKDVEQGTLPRFPTRDKAKAAAQAIRDLLMKMQGE